MAKKKLATVWLGGCSGCHMSLLDIDERILDVAKLADIVKSPVVDGKEFPDVDIALIEGSVTSDEHQHELMHMRAHSKILIALGDCAVTTNVTGMRNYFNLKDVFDTAYVNAISNDQEGEVPNHPALLKLNDKVVPLQELVHIDFVIPGCPPDADTIFYVLFEFLNDRVPDLSKVKKLRYG
ncbi:MAG: NADP oxidoreductase [Chitinophagaceae bacterium]|nr:NADP oxidoreductase [Chitinophagaceae bacterium]